jgi:hypothetical protein
MTKLNSQLKLEGQDHGSEALAQQPIFNILKY